MRVQEVKIGCNLNGIKKASPFKLNGYWNIFNICSSTPVNITKIVKLINKFYKKEKLVIYKKRRKGEMIKTFGDNRYLKKIIKKRKFMNIEKGIIKTINNNILTRGYIDTVYIENMIFN